LQIFMVGKIVLESVIEFFEKDVDIETRNEFLSAIHRQTSTTYRAASLSNRGNTLIYVGRVIWILIISYFFKIILNYVFFLMRRTAAYEAYKHRGARTRDSSSQNQSETQLYRYIRSQSLPRDQSQIQPYQFQPMQYRPSQLQDPNQVWYQQRVNLHSSTGQLHMFEPPPPYDSI
ncbi:hypothetical protein PENTCL1PPCAC_30443, partial [Pristionchus entomophagus]